jgi:hypothetical protein
MVKGMLNSCRISTTGEGKAFNPTSAPNCSARDVGHRFQVRLGYSTEAADLSAKRGIVEIGQGKAAG